MSVPATDQTAVPTTDAVPQAETPQTVPETQAVPEATQPAPGVQADATQPQADTVNVEDVRTYREEDVQPLPTGVSDEEPLEADDIPDDIKRLLEDPNGPFQLESGQVVVIRQLKFREFLAMLRIITRGASVSMSGLQLNFGDTDSFVQTLFAMMLFAIPEADEEVVRFIQSMVEPAELTGNKKVDDEKRIQLATELSNPEMEDVVNIIAKVIAAEGADLQALGKRLMKMWTVASKMGVTKGIPTA